MCHCVALLCSTLAGQGVVADDGDAEALSVLLGERNLVDLISLQIGLKHTHSSPPAPLVLQISH